MNATCPVHSIRIIDCNVTRRSKDEKNFVYYIIVDSLFKGFHLDRVLSFVFVSRTEIHQVNLKASLSLFCGYEDAFLFCIVSVTDVRGFYVM